MNFLASLDPGQHFLDVALSTLVQVTVLVALLALLARLLWRHRADARHALWLGALGWLFLSPAVSVLAGRLGPGLWTLSIPQADSKQDLARVAPDIPVDPSPSAIEPTPEITPPRAAAADARTSVIRREPVREPGGRVASPSHFRHPAAAVVVLIWLIGVVIGLARILLGWKRLAALSRGEHPLDSEIHRETLGQVRDALGGTHLPPIVISPAAGEPAAVGLFMPRVVLPEGLAEALSSEALRQTLVHECAHVLRHDLLTGLLQRLAGAVYWPHPLVHYLNGQLALAREEVCDNHVLRLGDRVGYARTLLTLTETYRSLGKARPEIGLLSFRWTLTDRIAGLLDPRRVAMTRTSFRMKITLAAAIAATGLTAACLRIGTAARANEPQPTQTERLATVPAAPPEEAWRIEGRAVDEQGKPVAGATIRSVPNDGAADEARTTADGSFALALRQDRPFVRGLVAEIDGGARIGLARFENARDAGSREPVKIIMKPSRPVTVRVKDAAGSPVPGAAVEAIDFSFHTHSVTGTNGAATLRVAADARVQWVIGYKSGVGFDYFENSSTGPAAELPPLPAELTLKLDGAQTIRVKAVDSSGHPVSGVDFAPLSITKAGKIRSANVGRSAIVKATTGNDGIASFNWYPKNAGGATFFVIRSGPYTAAELPRFERGGPTELTCRLLRDTRLSGAVRFPDGRPAPGVLVRAQGSSVRVGRGIVAARTGNDGSYRLDVPPESSYMIAIEDENWAASSLPNVPVREGQPQAGLDFTLIKGTLIRGQITVAADHRPEAGADVLLIEEGGPLPREDRRAGRVKLQLTRRSITDAQGRYHFRVGPGSYWLMPPILSGKASLPVIVKAEAEIVKDLMLDRTSHETYFTGVVIEKTPTGERAVADARVHKIGVGGGIVMSATDAQGRFRMLNTPGEHFLYTRAPQGLAGFTSLPRNPDGMKVVVSPSTTVSGRVVDSNGKALARHRVGVALASGSDSFRRSLYFAFQIRTDETGRFRVGGVPAGSVGEFSAYHKVVEGRETPRTVVRFEVPDLEPVQVPDLVVPAVKPAR